MAYSAYQYSGGILYPEHASQIVIDSAADLADINLDVVAPGTRVVDCSSGSMYILSPGKEWKLIQNNVAAASKSVGTESVSGAVAAFPDGADDVAVKSLVAEITPVQSGSGDPSPSNIRPINGRTGLTVTAASKNLMPNMAGTATNTTNGITFTYNDDGSFTINGTATANAHSRSIDYVSTYLYLPHGTYKKPVLQNGNIGVFVQYMKSSSNWTSVTGGGTASDTFVIDEDYPIIIRVAVVNGTTVNNVRFEPYVYPDSVNDLTWVSPVKTNYPISWQTEAGTIYGGTLNVTTGVLTVTDVCITLTSSSTHWQKSTAYPGNFFIPSASFAYDYHVPEIKNYVPFVCSHAKSVTRVQDLEYGCCFMDGSVNIRIMQGSDTLEDWLNYIDAQVTAGTPVQICWELATPQTYQLTPTEVRTILGGNTIFTDAGSVAVDYIADTKLYIDNKVAELQALILEN